MPPDTYDRIVDLGQRWAQTQLLGDADALASLLTDGFKLVGPAGFVLDKQQWIDQFRSGRLRLQTLDWDEVDVREHGE